MGQAVESIEGDKLTCPHGPSVADPHHFRHMTYFSVPSSAVGLKFRSTDRNGCQLSPIFLCTDFFSMKTQIKPQCRWLGPKTQRVNTFRYCVIQQVFLLQQMLPCRSRIMNKSSCVTTTAMLGHVSRDKAAKR